MQKCPNIGELTILRDVLQFLISSMLNDGAPW